MQFTFFGHAAVGVAAVGVAALGARVLFDPYSSQIGYAPIDEDFDFVCVSHDNARYHSCLDEVRADEVIDALQLAQNGEVLERRGLRFGAIEVFEDAHGNGPNAMAWLDADGARVLHMGDCGHALSPDVVAQCERVDVLLALAGGAPTIAIPDLLDFIQALQPRIVAPIHYGLPQLKTMSLQSVDEFARGFAARFGVDAVVHGDSPVFDLQDAAAERDPQLLILPPAR